MGLESCCYSRERCTISPCDPCVHPCMKFCFISGTLTLDPHGMPPPQHFPLVRVGESTSDLERSLSRPCNLTAHSTFCIRGMFGPAASGWVRHTASNASAVEETARSSEPPLLNLWVAALTELQPCWCLC